MFIGGFETSWAASGLIDSIFDKFGTIFGNNTDFINLGVRYVLSLFDYLFPIIRWLSSYTGLEYSTIYIILGLITSGLAIMIGFYTIKLVIKYWSMLVP